MPDDFDALDYTREQLRVLVEEAQGTEVTREFRLGLGLLAAQVATAERIPPPAPKPAPAVSIWGPAVASDVAEDPDPVAVVAPDGSSTVWDVELLGRILAAAKPTGVEMIKAIADEGGRISKDRFLEVTGRRSMAGMTQAVRSAITTASGDLMGRPRGSCAVDTRTTTNPPACSSCTVGCGARICVFRPALGSEPNIAAVLTHGQRPPDGPLLRLLAIGGKVRRIWAVAVGDYPSSEPDPVSSDGKRSDNGYSKHHQLAAQCGQQCSQPRKQRP
ncbi:hypothetical protein FHY52_23145 [Nocardia nova]|uniref:hypothetical protein n=1 Tax=Nocardia nova TaxID=37330 RepID=UPI0025AF1D60|nr:hypothetical protein [Nocardia nova]MDN2499547.1 hypothetical protein [Nocardia nova]